MNYPDLTHAHLAMRLQEAKSFRQAHGGRRPARAHSARPAVAWRLGRLGRKPVPAPAIS